MAQTKRKRRTKHRGTAAGTIQTRGRTGRPLSAEERKKQTKTEARERRLNTPPTWKGSFTRAAIVAPLIFLFVVFTSKASNRVAAGLILTLVALVVYTPGGYYMELAMYRRRQKRKQQQQAPK
jgi:Flp pilus assembly protein TadB